MISVIGDVMIDKYIYGTSYRQSPECSTAPVVVVTSKEEMIGGAGNTAINIYNLNAPVRLYCSVGYDGNVRNTLYASLTSDGGTLSKLDLNGKNPTKYNTNRTDSVLIKSLEDMYVNYEGMIRTAHGVLVQYLFGDSGIDQQRQTELKLNLIK